MRRPSHERPATLALGLALAAAVRLAAAPEPPPVDFARDIRPLFAARCFECHGPDKRRGGLRFDRSEDAFRRLRSGRFAIVPGDPGKSRLLELVQSDDEEEFMPPKGERLKPREIEALRRWIAGGAPWIEHWAFSAPERPPLPAVANRGWPRVPIDHFVLARLERESLSPSPEAPPSALVRRLSFDLTGLPPTPEEIREFLRDRRPDAFERLVERFLASPRYGERWARWWLDAARYADTNGYEKDRHRSIWRYRDWVIGALNEGMPFDRFTIEQVAGDMLPGATQDEIVATGFHRNTMVNEEGGIDVEEFRYESIVDRVNTTGTVFLGLTVGCAQCHNHKYDPISQREYYRFFAFLNNADEPEMDVRSEEIESRRLEIERRARRMERQLERRLSPEELAAKLAAWESSARQKSVPWRPLTPAKFSSRRRATLRLLADRSLLVGGDRPNYDTYDVEFDTDLKGITALRLEVLPHPSLPDGGPGRARMFQRGDFLLSEIRVEAWPRERPDEAVEVAIRHGSHDYAAKERSAALTLDGEYDTGWSVKGRTGQPHAVVYELAAPLGFDGGTRFRVTLAQRYIHQMTIGRFRMSATTERPPVRASGFPAAIEAALLQPPAERDAEERATLRSYFLSVTPELADERRKIAELRQSMPRHPTTLVLRERDDRRATRIHLRGEFLREGDEVEPGVFDFLHPLPGATPRDRLALARWLVSRENPLVARVTVNRVWQAFFGQGLVTTPEDFGFQGALPSHPALLDWLAVEFMDAGWSLKALHRLIATSATYRQSSRLRPELMEADPAGLLLARGPRLRLDAEMIRDGALRAAGRLSQRIGGPSVFPPQPDGVGRLAWGGFHWKTSSGDDRYRRGLYTYWKRTIPFPGATVFDAPTADTCCVRRQKSNTPLQALTLLNDPVYVEAARGLAARVLRETSSGPGSFERRLRRLFLLCLSRPPDERERERVHSFLLAQRRRLARDELEPRDIAGKVPEDLDAVELALWTLTSRVILNLDESITKE